MEKAAKDSIRELVLKLRKTLEAEVERELGRYGIYANRKWIPAAELPRLTEQERDLDRPRIEAAIHREQDAGLSREGAVAAFVRETAYTHLNRLLGLKCMEMRGLIKETITTRDIYSNRSQRHRDYLDENPQAHREQDRGLIAMLQAAYSEISLHIGVLFDPDSDYTVVWPRHTTVSDCIGWINALDEQVADKLGEDTETMTSVYADDTFLGWVYQYFQEDEKKRVFAAVNKKKKKISGYDIIPATSLYTERYMVQFLVENSLGALWMEMYPHSDLCQSWDYFVEDPNLQNEDGSRRPGQEPKPVAELTMLDPAGGSGHFLLYGFDLFAQMYEAEARQQGKWADKVQIARDILRHNLYGIDIDLRSIQLSALNLYMKACVYAGVDLAGLRNHAPVQMNLVCADIVLQEGPELEELLQVFSDDPLTQELIRTLWHGLANARELGSLLKIEEPLNELIVRKQAKEKGSWFERPQEMWEQWKQDLLTQLKPFAERAVDSFDINRRMFGQEAIKGTRLLDLLTRRYDVVATNPPYMGSHRMGESLLSGVKALFPKSSRDLYSCFIERCISLSSRYSALVTMHGFMFLSSYSKLRKFVLDHGMIRTLAHLGDYAFETVADHAPAAMYSIDVSRSMDKLQGNLGVFIRAVDTKDKINALKNGIYILQSQKNFYLISKQPWLYWIRDYYYDLFRNLPSFDDNSDQPIAKPRRGLDTGNVPRFIRYFWEIVDNQRWKSYLKGGDTRRWYGDRQSVVDWGTDGNKIKSYAKSIVPSEELYFCPGATFSRISRTGLNARPIPEQTIIGFNGPGVFSDSYSPEYLTGLLNSKLIAFLSNLINPTHSFQTGDLARLPFKIPSLEIQTSIEALAKDCITLMHQIHNFDITEPIFIKTYLMACVTNDQSLTLHKAHGQYQGWLEENLIRVFLNEAAIDELVFHLYETPEQDKTQALEDRDNPVGAYPILNGYELNLSTLLPQCKSYLNRLPRTNKSPDEITKLKKLLIQLFENDQASLEQICAELELNPVSITALRQEMNYFNTSDFKEAVKNLITQVVWESVKKDNDGIIPYATGLHNLSLLEQVHREIEVIFSTARAVDIETEINEALGRSDLSHWLGNSFFKQHVTQFQRRPFLWQITSPQQRFRTLIYYHKLDRDTLPKIRSRYLGPLLTRARTESNNLRRHDPDNIKAIGELEEYIADLQDCEQRLESVIQGTVDVELPEWANGPYRHGRPPYDPDLDDGVYVNILPLQEAGLLPIKVV